MFLFPFEIRGERTILIGAMANELQAAIGAGMRYFTTFFFLLGGLLTALVNFRPGYFATRHPGIYEMFECNAGWAFLRCAGAVFATMTFLGTGPEWIHGESTGQVAYVDVAGLIFLLIGMGCILLPLLTDFGFMEFVGTLLRGAFRRTFGLPGRATIDTLASWLGASSIAVLVTSTQYAKGYYTGREAAVISTNFSVVSVPFVVLIAQVAGISELFVELYAAMLVIGLICALATPRIPPLSRIKDDYYAPVGRQIREDERSKGSKVSLAMELALAKAESAPSPLRFMRLGLRSVVDLFLTMMPAAMTFMFTALAVYHYTEVLQIISYPLIPVLQLLQVPEATLAAPGVIVGLLDQFVPAVIAGSIDDKITSFVLAGLAVTQLIFFAETAVLIVRSKIPLSVLQLVTIFCLRTAIALPILAFVANVIV